MDIFSAFGFDPLRTVQEIAVIVGVSAGLVLAWAYRGRILLVLTNDDRIHGDVLDFVWFTCCQGCGLCTGDWTRCLTVWSCCPRRIRGANLLESGGRWFGMTTYSVEIKNITVGDLPVDRPADFYLVVECAANPPMMTSVAEDKFPKVVHFPEMLTLRLRWSPLEEGVRITVRELNLLGSQDLCHCNIKAMQILDWYDHPDERIKRFEMKPSGHGLEHETPAWILLEFGTPTEVRDLDHFHVNTQGGPMVRTSTSDGHYVDRSITTFKRDYALLDSNGNVMDEPPEEDLREVARCKALASGGFHVLNFVTLVVIAFCLCSRAYVSSCHRQYRGLTMAYMHNASDFPIKGARLEQILSHCHARAESGRAEPGAYCQPSLGDIMGLCNSTAQGGHFPEGQHRPRAFSGLTRNWLGAELGVPCLNGVCAVRNGMVKFRSLMVGSCIALVIVNCFFNSCMRCVIARRRKVLQNRRHDLSRKAQEHVRSLEPGLRTFF